MRVAVNRESTSHKSNYSCVCVGGRSPEASWPWHKRRRCGCGEEQAATVDRCCVGGCTNYVGISAVVTHHCCLFCSVNVHAILPLTIDYIAPSLGLETCHVTVAFAGTSMLHLPGFFSKNVAKKESFFEHFRQFLENKVTHTFKYGMVT